MQQEKGVIFRGSAPDAVSATNNRTALTSHYSVTKIFLLSPANAAGARAQRLLRPECDTELVLRLQDGGVPLGELFSFMSSLYFRGKLTYAQTFAAPPPGSPGALVITPSRGLLSPNHAITARDLQEMASFHVDPEDQRYRGPLERDARKLLQLLGPETQIVLLGSVATPKYIEPLLQVFTGRLVFPAEFVGRGDMSRGGLLLRCSRDCCELAYIPVATSILSRARSANPR